MADPSSLGAQASWHIRSIPEAVRQAVVDQAHAERMSVAELITRLLSRPRSPTRKAMPATVEHAVDADRLLKLLQAADLVSRVVLPPRAQSAARAMIATEIRSMRRAQLPPKRARLEISGPEYPAETPSDPPESI